MITGVKPRCRGRRRAGSVLSEVSSMADEQWPYPAYADRNWLGGERGPDRELAAVVRALRGLVTESGGRPSTETEALVTAAGHLAAIAERVDWALLSVVGEARARGLSWQAIGTAL